MNNELFETYPVPKAIAKLAIPTMLGMLVNVIYNMADTFFVGQTQDQNQVAAVTFSLPIYMLLFAIGNTFAIGSGAYISRLLGQKDYEKIKNTSAFTFYIPIILSIIFAIVVILLMNPILKFLGTSSATYGFTKDYLYILLIGGPFICIQNACGGIIRSEGSSRQAMVGMMVGTIANIILDPIMILYMGMGVKGAALATVLGNVFSCVYYIIYLIGKKTCLSINIKYFVMKKEIVKNILAIGIPVSLNTILLSCSSIIINNFAAYYGDTVVAALGIASRVSTISTMLLFGLAQGTQPFIGYNYSTRNYDRMNKAIKFSTVSAIVIGTILLIFIIFFSQQIVKVFLNDENVIGYGKYFSRALASSAPILGVQFIFMYTFQAMGKGGPSLFLSVLRQGIAFIPAIIIGNMLLGLNGIVWAQPTSDLISVVISSIMYYFMYKKMKQQINS